MQLRSNINKVYNDFKKLEDGFDLDISKAFGKTGGNINNIIGDNLSTGKYGVKTRTGQLKNGINYTVNNNTLIVGNSTKYARALEYGLTMSGSQRAAVFYAYKKTGNKKALYAAMAGRIKPHYYFKNSVEDNETKWLRLFETYLMDKING